MLVTTLLAALAALPAITAQSTSTATRTATDCFTHYGFDESTETSFATLYFSTATTNTVQLSITTQSTVTVTPSATHYTNIATVLAVTTMTSTSKPPASTVDTPSAFVPLVLVNVPAPTTVPVISRFKRFELEGPDEVTHLLRRQTPPGYSGGLIAYPNGTYTGLYRRYPQSLNCTITLTYDETVTTIVRGEPVTRFAQQKTVTDLSTVTRTQTSTVTAEVAAETIYAACAANNVVNHITAANGSTMYFDRVTYRPREGFPMQNEIIMYTPDPISCCVQCHKTDFCAGSIYATGYSECHLRLTQPYFPAPSMSALPLGLPSGVFPGDSSNGTLGIATSVSTTRTGAPQSISTNSPSGGSCKAGGLSLYLGTIRGQEQFPEKVAMYFSNGRCGRFSVNPVPLPQGAPA